MLADSSDPRLPAPVRLFQRVFSELRPDNPIPYQDLYAPEVVFEDPLQRAEGLEAVRQHFEGLNANLRVCRFEYGPTFLEDRQAILSWTMRLELRRGPRQPVVVPGLTHLRFVERIVSHRDHFDAGALIYEHVPLLGSMIRLVKRRLKAAGAAAARAG